MQVNVHHLLPCRLAVPRRGEAECLADELSHLGEDDAYARTLRDGIPLIGRSDLPAADAVASGVAPSTDHSRTLARTIAKNSAVRRT